MVLFRRKDSAHFIALVILLSLGELAHCSDGLKYDENDPTGYFTSNSLHEKYDQQLTFDQYITYSIRSLALVAGFDNDLHRYDSKQDLIDSYERQVNLSNPSHSDVNFVRLYDRLDWASTGNNPEAGPKRQRRRHDRVVDSSELELFSEQSESRVIENDINQEECSDQLDQLIGMSLKLYRNFESYSSSKQLSLIDFLDSFGSAPSEQFMMSNNFWLGSHEQCSRARVQYTDTQSPSTGKTMKAFDGRYCVAKLRSPSWPNPSDMANQGIGDQSIRLGICLPRSCNSISILRHGNKIETLIKMVRFQQVPFSSYRLQNLYCLPDENSPLRQLSPSAQAFISCLSVWLIIVAYFSLKYEFLLSKGEPEENLDKWIKIFAFRHSWRTLFGYGEPVRENGPGKSGQDKAKVMDSLIQNGLSLGLEKMGDKIISSERANIVPISQFQSPLGVKCPTAAAACNSNDTYRLGSADGPAKSAKMADRAPSGRRTNLSAVDGIKVISMIWLISAHTMLFFLRVISNGRDFWSIVLDARFMTIMAGIFPVDSFFTVTGVLTACLKFNKNHGMAMKRPAYWIETFLHRYLRFMPMYLLIFWYTRDVSQYIGQGPLWDYATANTSLRSMCKQESVTVPLLFQANFKPIDKHCVKPAWYLANDYQYLLITPFYILLLIWSKWLGYLSILATIAASLVAQFYTVYHSDDFKDFEGLVNFRPMFATYVLKDLWKLYTLPYNRIAPYLIGLLTGHLIYSRNNKEKNLNLREDKQKDDKLIEGKHYNQPPIGERTATAATSTTDNNDAEEFYPEQIRRISNIFTIDQTTPQALASLNQQTELKLSDINQHGENNTSTCKQQENLHFGSQDCSFHQVANQQNIYGVPGKEPYNSRLFSLISFLRHHLCINVWIPLMLSISIIYLPMLTKLKTHEGQNARIGASLIIALMRLFWSIAIARLIYVCCSSSSCTDNDGRNSGKKSRSFIVSLLSSSLWKPWSKIGLSVLLIQWEIIGYLAQIQTAPPFMSISYMLACVLISILASYAIGLLIYLIIEFPLSQIEHYYIHPKIFPKN